MNKPTRMNRLMRMNKPPAPTLRQCKIPIRPPSPAAIKPPTLPWGTERDSVWVYWDKPWPDVFFERPPPPYYFVTEIEQLEIRRQEWIEGMERDAYERQESASLQENQEEV